MKPGSQGTSLGSAGGPSTSSRSRSPWARAAQNTRKGEGPSPRRGTRPGKGGALERGRARGELGLGEGAHPEGMGGAKGRAEGDGGVSGERPPS